MLVFPSTRPDVFHEVAFGACFLLSFVLLVVFHELGHVIAAVLVHQRVHVVRFGAGRVLWQGRIFGTRVEWRMVPLRRAA